MDYRFKNYTLRIEFSPFTSVVPPPSQKPPPLTGPSSTLIRRRPPASQKHAADYSATEPANDCLSPAPSSARMPRPPKTAADYSATEHAIDCLNPAPSSAGMPRLPKPQRITAPREMRTIKFKKSYAAIFFSQKKSRIFPKKNKPVKFCLKKIPEIFPGSLEDFTKTGGPGHNLRRETPPFFVVHRRKNDPSARRCRPFVRMLSVIPHLLEPVGARDRPSKEVQRGRFWSMFSAGL